MYTVTIHIDYLEKFGEMLPGDRTNAQHHLRELVKPILLQFFIEAAIDQVSILPLAGPEEEGNRFSVCIAAHCMSKTYPLVPQELTRMELVLEDRISCTLLELVGMVDVEDVSIVNASTQEEQFLSYHS
jgi:hypothetical protein